MIKLFIIADDFTGALDTGVQFAACGAATRVIAGEQCDFSSIDSQVEVLVQNAETRHLHADQARRVVASLVRRAKQAGIPYLYKKTDSALRGNIGSELEAMLAATGRDRIHFAPAFPQQRRTTEGGVHYIDGVLVHESVFGADPFEPVLLSDVAGIIAQQSDCPVTKLPIGVAASPEQAGILVYDAATDEHLGQIAKNLSEQGELQLLAGCAAFAATLPSLLGLQGKAPALPSFDQGFLVACGSVNPITRRQLACARREGFALERLTPRQKLDPAWMAGAEGDTALAQWAALCNRHENIIFDTNDPEATCSDVASDTERYATDSGLSLEEVRTGIAGTMGALVKRLLDNGVQKNLMLTGGDTLLAFIRHVGVEVLEPVCEMASGTVLSRLSYHGHEYNLISKSGGFGDERLLPELAQRMNHNRDRKDTIC